MVRDLPRMNHDRLWAAIDAIAHRHGLSASGLARRAGLDATAFNKSKRFTGDGRPRWPSTESIAKILDATGSDLDDLARLIDGGTIVRPPVHAVPLPAALTMPDGFREGSGGVAECGEVVFPTDADGLFAIAVADDGLAPLYRPGDLLIVSARAPIRPGDRVVVQTRDDRLMTRVFVGGDETGVTFETLAANGGPERLARTRLRWIARILWVSQ